MRLSENPFASERNDGSKRPISRAQIAAIASDSAELVASGVAEGCFNPLVTHESHQRADRCACIGMPCGEAVTQRVEHVRILLASQFPDLLKGSPQLVLVTPFITKDTHPWLNAVTAPPECLSDVIVD